MRYLLPPRTTYPVSPNPGHFTEQLEQVPNLEGRTTGLRGDAEAAEKNKLFSA